MMEPSAVPEKTAAHTNLIARTSAVALIHLLTADILYFPT